MPKSISILLVEDQKILRDTLIPKLRQENIITIGEASNGLELMELLNSENVKPDIILLDLEMKGMNGNEALRVIKKKYSKIKVIIHSGFSDGALINDFIAKGASSYVTKDSGFDTLVDVIRKTILFEDFTNVPEKVSSLFTEGESQVIPYILSGKTSAEIAEILGKSKSTIDGYRERLYEKTDTTNSSEFTKYCSREGLYFLGFIEGDNVVKAK